jgi:hypothetical protein
MYARLVNLVLKNVDDRIELTDKIERDILPILRKQDGFHNEIMLSTPDRPEVTAISFWNDREHAEEYNVNTYPGILESLSIWLKGTPVVSTFEVSFSTMQQMAG